MDVALLRWSNWPRHACQTLSLPTKNQCKSWQLWQDRARNFLYGLHGIIYGSWIWLPRLANLGGSKITKLITTDLKNEMTIALVAVKIQNWKLWFSTDFLGSRTGQILPEKFILCLCLSKKNLLILINCALKVAGKQKKKCYFLTLLITNSDQNGYAR